MKNLFRFSVAAAFLASTNAQYFKTVEEAHNPGEERDSFEIIMKPYPIPAELTTYTDFFFNLPEDLPDLVHITYGEVINSQPIHLHHFVLTGCTEPIPEDEEGLPNEFGIENTALGNCQIPLGGWAPGADLFGNTDLNTGVLLGRGMGIQAIMMNVHYTDGVYLDEAKTQLKMAEDGIRIHWTPNMRPYTDTMRPLINIGWAPRQLSIPPGEKRFFVSRTCEVVNNCQDAEPSELQAAAAFMSRGDNEMSTAMSNAMNGMDLSCPNLKLFCGMPGQIGMAINMLCPESCGNCNELLEDGVTPNPLAPESYRVTSIQYHAHLLGREMYTTLLREENTSATTAIQKQAQTTSSNMVATDLESRPFWIYDFQETIPLQFEVVADENAGETILEKGTEVVAGDKIQATCVYDATERDEKTQFDLSTYDEMCITSLKVTFATPEAWKNNESTLDISTQLRLMSFGCKAGSEYAIYSGTLAEGEDGRDIWKDHPISSAEGCIFPINPVAAFLGAENPGEAQNCPSGDNDVFDNLNCGNVEFFSENIAGKTCSGGTLNEQDSNSGVTEEDCVAGGGSFVPYTCSQISDWVNYEGQLTLDEASLKFVVENWWQPECCGDSPVFDNLNCGEDVEFFSNKLAGYTCYGGTLNEQSSHSGVTEEACVAGGGSFEPYTCSQANDWVNSEGQSTLDEATLKFLVEDWWQPECCGDSSDEPTNESLDSSSDEVDYVSSAPGLAKSGLVLSLVSAAVVIFG